MSATSISWTHMSGRRGVTWNPVRGCSRVSPGCGGGTPGGGGGCYAEAIAARFSGPGQAFEGYAEMTAAGPRWTGKRRLRTRPTGRPVSGYRSSQSKPARLAGQTRGEDESLTTKR